MALVTFEFCKYSILLVENIQLMTHIIDFFAWQYNLFEVIWFIYIMDQYTFSFSDYWCFNMFCTVLVFQRSISGSLNCHNVRLEYLIHRSNLYYTNNVVISITYLLDI